MIIQKNILKKVFAVSLIFLIIFAFSACKSKEKSDLTADAEALWQSATYTEDTVLGNGSKTVKVEVKASGKSITFTLKTDKENLEDALLEHELIDGEKNEFGLYIKYANGIQADYDKDKAYWSLSKDGVMLTVGAAQTKISNGDKYEITYAE